VMPSLDAAGRYYNLESEVDGFCEELARLA
jgi:hypothetical protein